MTENLSEMVAESAPGCPEGCECPAHTEEAPVAPVVDDTLEKGIVEFAQSLSADIKTVSHGNTVSIKMKNRNFVYLTKSKKTPLKVQVKSGKDWPVYALGLEDLKKVIQDSFNALQ